MTAQEAIQQIKDNDCTVFCKGVKVNCSECRWGVAIPALEKQIQKTPFYEGDVHEPDGTLIWCVWACPNCGATYKVDYEEHDYCPECGQAIDWSVK